MTPIPSTLDEAVDQLVSTLSQIDRAYIEATPLRAFRGGVHMSAGMGLRNEWRLWDKDGPLNEELAALGFHHGDDRSGLLLAMLWSCVHEVPFDIAAEAESNRAHWARAGVNPDGTPL